MSSWIICREVIGRHPIALCYLWGGSIPCLSLLVCLVCFQAQEDEQVGPRLALTARWGENLSCKERIKVLLDQLAIEK